MEYNLFVFIWVLLSFFILFVLIPWNAMGFKIEEGRVLQRVFQSMAAGMAVVISLVYVLAFFGMLTGWVLWPLIVGGIALLRWRQWQRGRTTEEECTFFAFFLERFEAFEFEPFTRKIGAKIKEGSLTLLQIFKKQPVFYGAIFLAFAYGAWLRIEPNIAHSFFKNAEVYTQAIRTQGLMNGTVFYDGVYPLGMHGCAAALSVLFGIDVTLVLAHLGSIVGCFLLLGLCLFAEKIFRAKPAVVLTMILYCAADIMWDFPTMRQAAALPQEMAVMLLLPAVCMFLEYLRTGDKQDLFCLGAAIAVISYTHFGGVVALALVLLVFFASHGYYMHQTGMLKPAAIGIGICLGILPVAAGFSQGGRWNADMERAFSALTTVNLPVEGVEREYYTQSLTETAIGEFVQMDYHEMATLVFDRELPLREKLSYGNLEKVRHYYYSLIFSHIRWVDFYGVSLGILGIFAIAQVVYAIRKEKPLFRRLNLLALVLCAVMLTLLVGAGYLGIPQIVEIEMIILLMGIFGVLIIGGSFEFLMWVFYRDGKMMGMSEISFVCAAVAMAALIQADAWKKPNVFPVLQYEDAISAYRQIQKDYKNNWVIISTRDALAFVKGGQYHFEISDFVLAQAKRELQPELTIQGENLFLFVENPPLNVEKAKGYAASQGAEGDAAYNINYFALQNAQEALESYGMNYDSLYANPDARAVVGAKAQTWVHDYISRYPENITVYSRGENLTVYRIKQKKEAPGNLILE